MTREAQNHLNHEAYKNLLLSGGTQRATNIRISSRLHVLETTSINKISLSAYEDKRYICDDGVTTLPHGYYKTVEEQFFENILKSPNWGVVTGYDPETWSDLELPETLLSVQQPEETLLDVLSGNSFQSTIERSVFQTANSIHNTELITIDSTPDPGLIRTAMVTESDISDNSIVDFDREITPSPEIDRNPFILSEAQDTDGEGSNWEYLITSEEEDSDERMPTISGRPRRRQRDIRVTALSNRQDNSSDDDFVRLPRKRRVKQNVFLVSE